MSFRISGKKQIHSNAHTYLRHGDCQLIVMSSNNPQASRDELKRLQEENKSLKRKCDELEKRERTRSKVSRVLKKEEQRALSLKMVNKHQSNVLLALLNVQDKSRKQKWLKEMPPHIDNIEESVPVYNNLCTQAKDALSLVDTIRPDFSTENQIEIYCTQSKTFVKILLKDFDFTELRENAGPVKCQNMFCRLRMFMLKLWDAKKTYDKTKTWSALPEESAHADATTHSASGRFAGRR